MGMDEHACECGKAGYSMNCKECYEQAAINEFKAKLFDKMVAYLDENGWAIFENVPKDTLAPLTKILRDAEKL